MPWKRNVLATDEGVAVRPDGRVRVGMLRKEQTIIMIVGLFVGLWAFDSSGGDGAAFLIFSLIVACAFLASWYVRLPDD